MLFDVQLAASDFNDPNPHLVAGHGFLSDSNHTHLLPVYRQTEILVPEGFEGGAGILPLCYGVAGAP